MTLKVLINGGGVAGPALANFLLRSNRSYDITVVERAPKFRAGGTQIDFKSYGTILMRKLGLIEAVQAEDIYETGFAFVDKKGKEWASFQTRGPNPGGHRPLTSEYEIMRKDLVAVLYNGSIDLAAKHSPTVGAGLRYLLGKHAIELNETTDKVSVVFSDGSSGEYDFVVGADGQSSLTRRLLFGDETGDHSPIKEVGASVCYFNMPKSKTEVGSSVMKGCILPGKIVALRCAHKDFTQSMLFAETTDELREVVKRPVEEQKAVWTKLFKGVGWESERLLAGMQTADDFYMTTVAQVKADVWSKGRVVLLGDAGYCPSVMTGLGTTVSLVGAYVLAGELARHGNDVTKAFNSYEKVLRPFIEESHKLSPGAQLFRGSSLVLGIFYVLLAVISTFKLDRLIWALTLDEKNIWKLPEYPELRLEPVD